MNCQVFFKLNSTEKVSFKKTIGFVGFSVQLPLVTAAVKLLSFIFIDEYNNMNQDTFSRAFCFE